MQSVTFDDLYKAKTPLSDLHANVHKAAMLLVSKHHIHTEPQQRTDVQFGYANGFKERPPGTRLGTIERSTPQVRDCDEAFRPSSLDVNLAPVKALRIILTEMTIQGVEPRRIKDVLKALRGSVSQRWKLARQQRNFIRAVLLSSASAWGIHLHPLWSKGCLHGFVLDLPELPAAGIRNVDTDP